MKFETLKANVMEKAEKANGDVAVYISTKNRDIKWNETQPIRAASLIKIPIVMACQQAAEKGWLDLDEKLKVENTVPGAGVLHYLSGENQEFTIQNLMELALIVSDNTASNLLIKQVGIQPIQQFIDQTGAKQTELNRLFMDETAIKSGLENYTSAQDMNTFLKLIDTENTLLSHDSRSAIYRILSNQQFKHKLATYQPNDITIANKTGELDSVEHDVGIFEKDNQRVYVSVLTSEFNANLDAQQWITNIGKDMLDYIKIS